MKKETIVLIDKWIVADQTNCKSLCTTGVVVSDVITEKVYGYKDEYNHYIKVKLDDGIIETFNLNELKPLNQNKMKQTAVEWLENEMQKTYIFNQNDFDMFKKAKQMEKEQIMFDYINGVIDTLKGHENVDSDKYYNEEYGKL